MSVKKSVLLCLFAALAVSAFAGGQKSSSPARGGQVTLKVATWEEDISYNINIREAFAKAHPDIKLELISIPSADYTQKLSVMLNGGSDVDAFWIKDGDTTKGLVNRGQLADLGAYVKKDNINLKDYNGLAERFNIGGKLVALPASTGYYVLYYNKDIFDKAGVPYPSNDMTWDEWEALAKKLSSGSGNNKVWGSLLHTWPACVQNWAVQDGKRTIMDTDYGFFKPYYEMVLRMQDAGTLWDYGSLRTGGIHYSSAFLQGNIAMLPMGTWYFYTILDRIKAGETKIRFGIATLPHPQGVPAGWTVGSVTPIAINQASKQKDAAWEFVKFVTGEEGAKIYAAGGGIPSRANSQTLEAIASIPGMPEGSLAALMVKNIALDRPMADFVAEVNQMLGEEHSLIMLKEVPVDQGLANMAKRSKEIQGK